MHRKALSPDARTVLKLISPVAAAQGFVLAGDTAAVRSIDLACYMIPSRKAPLYRDFPASERLGNDTP
jgi:hypothetical protein